MSYTTKFHNKRESRWYMSSLNYRTHDEAYGAAVKEFASRWNIDRWSVIQTTDDVNSEFYGGRVYELNGPQHTLVRGKENAEWKAEVMPPAARLAASLVDFDNIVHDIREALDDLAPTSASLAAVFTMRQYTLQTIVNTINKELTW